MNLTGGIVLYASLWFLALFIVIPIGQKSQAEAGEVMVGTHAGAPHNPPLLRKAIYATILSAIMWGIIAAVIFSGYITRDDIAAFGR